ncbi:MAG: RDD family protein [Thermoplasmata archaeon]|nr:RDD family protein [Candidatus Sysuiplasma acidicola]MBX8645700.1 RDD family protein [Candidatus Sysuiplasma acidicola]
MKMQGCGMPIAIEMLFRNSILRSHWIKRAAAGLIDTLTVFVPVWAVGMTFGFGKLYFELFVGIASGICWFIYSTSSEYFYGYTLGKKIMALRVSSQKGELNLHEAVFRNIAKLFWYILLPLDVILGLFTYGDPRQRFTDRVFGTTVVSTHPASSLIKVRLRHVRSYE